MYVRNLKIWIHNHGLTFEEFGEMVGLDEKRISDINRGMLVSKKTRDKILDVTNGQVSVGYQYRTNKGRSAKKNKKEE